jgi:hypothetical protein
MPKSDFIPEFVLHLPEPIRQEAIKTARREGISLERFIVSAIAEKIGRFEDAPPGERHNRAESKDLN